jgi:type I restriction enzyme M protein
MATIEDIEAQGWSLNPGRYVGIVNNESQDFDFAERFEELNEEFEVLCAESSELEQTIAANVVSLLGAQK